MTLGSTTNDREFSKFVEDANGNTAVRMLNPLSRYGALATKTVTFTGAAGVGAAGTVNLFTVTGDIHATVWATCSSDLTTSGAATIVVGTTSDTDCFIASTTATTIDANEIWITNTPTAGALPLPAAQDLGAIITNGEDIIATIASANVTGGVITFYCLYTPLSSNAAVVAA